MTESIEQTDSVQHSIQPNEETDNHLFQSDQVLGDSLPPNVNASSDSQTDGLNE